jgi:hypothetical protein
MKKIETDLNILKGPTKFDMIFKNTISKYIYNKEINIFNSISVDMEKYKNKYLYDYFKNRKDIEFLIRSTFVPLKELIYE